MSRSYSRFPDVASLTTAQRRLRVVLDLVDDDARTVEEIVNSHNISRSTAYAWCDRALEALTDRPPGPEPGWRDLETLKKQLDQARECIAQLETELQALQATLKNTVEITQRRREQLELVLTREMNSLRSIQNIVAVAYGEHYKPRLEDLQKRIHNWGRIAGNLFDTVTETVAPKIRCVAADDVYFHRKPIKLAIEPRSVAILLLGRWHGQAAKDWILWLSVFPALLLLVSDLGRDLVGAAKTAARIHQADWIHEVWWYAKHLFKPLSCYEGGLRKKWWATLLGATRPFGGGIRTQKATVDAAEAAADVAEDAFFTAVGAIDAVMGLFQAVNPRTGQLWTKSEQKGVVQRAVATLEGIGLRCTAAAAKHLKSNGHRYGAHLQMWDCIPVSIRPDSGWTRLEVLNGLLLRMRWERTLDSLSVQWDWAEWRSLSKKHARLKRRLESGCTNLKDVEHLVRRELAYPKRSSSAVESLNSRLRVVQMVHRNVSDELLWLHALAWNLTKRRLPGRRQGRSPYGMLEEELGVDLGFGDRPWYDVVLDEEARRAALPCPAPSEEPVSLRILPGEATAVPPMAPITASEPVSVAA